MLMQNNLAIILQHFGRKIFYIHRVINGRILALKVTISNVASEEETDTLMTAIISVKELQRTS